MKHLPICILMPLIFSVGGCQKQVAAPAPASAPAPRPAEAPPPPPQPATASAPETPQVPRAGYSGVTLPKCISCPAPAYTEQARVAKISGIVLLRLIVTPDGHATHITVTRSVGYGLDEIAVETVKSWQFDPARDSSGNPVAAWTTLEVVFRVK